MKQIVSCSSLLKFYWQYYPAFSLLLYGDVYPWFGSSEGKRQRGSVPCPLIFAMSRLAKRCDSAGDQCIKYISRSPWCFFGDGSSFSTHL